jgi:hypothetical protein
MMLLASNTAQALLRNAHAADRRPSDRMAISGGGVTCETWLAALDIQDYDSHYQKHVTVKS